jgi:hypothetical protein
MIAIRILKAFSLFLLLFVLTLTACKSDTTPVAVAGTLRGPTQPATFTVVPSTQGEIIEYGAVAGANSLASAMAGLLRQVDQACGERPSVGQVFAVRGTTSVAVFFTVVDHAQANRQLAGLVIAVQAGSNDFEAGLVADTADRFAQTANPMMQQLFSKWTPGASSGGGSAGSSSNAPAAIGPVHVATAPDNSASVSVPAGWTVDPVSFDGGIILHGTNGELLGLNLSKEAVDPTSAFQKKMAAAHATQAVDLQNAMFYAYRGDPAKEFAPFMQAWLKSDGMGSTQLQVQTVQAMPGSQSARCASASGQLTPSGGGAVAFNADICAQNPNQYGYYTVVVSLSLLPVSLGNQDQAVVKAIILSYKPNQQVMSQEYQQALQMKEQQDQKDLAISQMVVNNIHQQGAAAMARINATEDSEARNDAGFDNYLLDQSVVNSGGVHTTMWNREANALVQSNPNKYQIVDTPNYWQGVDY